MNALLVCYILIWFFCIGSVPSSLCDIGTLTALFITDFASNPLLTRSPMCLTTVIERKIPPNYQEAGICGFIAATNIANISNYDEWSCTSDGITSTDPCSPAWTGIGCSAGFIVDLGFYQTGFTGMFISSSNMIILLFLLFV